MIHSRLEYTYYVRVMSYYNLSLQLDYNLLAELGARPRAAEQQPAGDLRRVGRRGLITMIIILIIIIIIIIICFIAIIIVCVVYSVQCVSVQCIEYSVSIYLSLSLSIYIYIYTHIRFMRVSRIARQGTVLGLASAAASNRPTGNCLGWHYLSNAPCLIQPHSFHACFVVSSIVINCYSTLLATSEERTCVRRVVLDKWFPLILFRFVQAWPIVS